MGMMPPFPAASLNLWEDSPFEIVLLFVKGGIRHHFSDEPELPAVRERMEDADGLLEFGEAKRAEGGKKSIPLATVKRKLGRA